MVEEMRKFREMLDAEHIEWEDKSKNGEYPICRTHFAYNGERWSVINGFGTYGGYLGKENQGLLEAYALDRKSGEDLTGWRTAEEAMRWVKGESDG